jgi:acid phosphatase (class A)
LTRLLFAAALLIAFPAAAADHPYLTPAQVDLARLLPPPPTDNGPDMQAVLEAQRTRTPERVAQADADGREGIYDMFGSILGPRFANLPLATTLFERLGDTEEVVSAPAKEGFDRKRPFLVNPNVHPAIRLSKSASYPSGHATRVTMDGIVLAAMIPEYRVPIFARMADYAQSRVIGGVHYPSDIEAGKRAGTAIAAVLFNDPAFAPDFAAARREVRAAMGLPN